MKNLEGDVNIIRKVVWSYVKTNPGLEFDDLMSEAYILYLENIHLYDESKGKRSTFIYHTVRNHINTLLKKQRDIPTGDEMLLYADETPEHVLLQHENWDEFFRQLSPKARQICEIILGNDIYLPTDAPRKCRGIIMKELRKSDWSWNNIWDVFKELKCVCREH